MLFGTVGLVKPIPFKFSKYYSDLYSAKVHKKKAKILTNHKFFFVGDTTATPSEMTIILEISASVSELYSRMVAIHHGRLN